MEASAKGAVVERLNDNTIKIIRKVNSEDTEFDLRSTEGDLTVVDVVVEDLNISLGGEIRSESGELISRMANSHDFDEKTQKWIPAITHYEEYGYDETTGSHYVTKTTAYYDDYTFNQ